MAVFEQRPEGGDTVRDASLMKQAVTVISSASSPPCHRRLITGSIIAPPGLHTLFMHHWAGRQTPHRRRRLRPRNTDLKKKQQKNPLGTPALAYAKNIIFYYFYIIFY